MEQIKATEKVAFKIIKNKRWNRKMKKIFTRKAIEENTIELFITYKKNGKSHHITLWCTEEIAKSEDLTAMLIKRLQGLFSVVNLSTIDVMSQNGYDVQVEIWNDFFGYMQDVKEILVYL